MIPLDLSQLNDATTTILNEIDKVIAIENEEGKIIFVNKAIQDVLGYSPEEFLGLSRKKAASVLAGRKYSATLPLSKRVSKNDEKIKIRKYFHKFGHAVPMEVRAFPLFDKSNQRTGTVLILSDLHEDLLFEITKLVNSSLTLEEVIKNTSLAVTDYLGLNSTALFLLNEEKTELTLFFHNDYPSPEQCKKVKYKIGIAPPGRAVQNKKPVYVRNILKEPDIPDFAKKFHKDKSSMVYPLICNEEVLGAIAFDAHTVREFASKEKLLFQNIANQVATAVYNAQLFARVEHLSVTDGLTGLYNRRYLLFRLSEEIERAKRSREEVAFLMLDIDYFKHYNDTFGHVQGDELLKQLAQLIQKNVRSYDIVARYGGEEFAVMLPECSEEQAVKRADAIRNAIAEYPFYGAEKQPAGRLTVSIGVSTLSKSESKEKLIYYADQALYKAKRCGRNRVEVH